MALGIQMHVYGLVGVLSCYKGQVEELRQRPYGLEGQNHGSQCC